MNDFFLSLMLLGSVSGAGTAPFWSTAGCHGTAPESTGAVTLLGAGMDYDSSKTLQWHWGASLGALADGDGTALIPDQAYAGLRWKVLDLDIGIKHRETLCTGADPSLGSLSVTGCSLAWSGNCRSLPGYTLSLRPVDIPFTRGRVRLYGSWGDYMTTDSRYVQGSLVHNFRAGLEFKITGALKFTAALDHFAVWGGTVPGFGKVPVTLENYRRMCLGLEGGADATLMDRENTFGDQRGAELLALEYDGPRWNVELRHEIPYEDRSGMKFQNFPDGVNTLRFSRRDRDALLTDIVFEYHSTMWQSGEYERRPATADEIASGDPRLHCNEEGEYFLVTGGKDNYGNNYEYKSGWTFHGRSAGNPLFFPCGTLDGTLTRNEVCGGIENNRLRAFHLGLSGKMWRKAPYRLMLTLSRNCGTYNDPLGPLWQFSSGFQVRIPLPLHLSLVPGIYADCGNFLPRNVGATLGIRYLL